MNHTDDTFAAPTTELLLPNNAKSHTILATPAAHLGLEAFLTHHFGIHSKLFERHLHSEMKDICQHYEKNETWNIYNLSNGGCYLSPTRQAHYMIKFHHVRGAAEFDADTTGILATLLTLRTLQRQFPHLQRYAARRRHLHDYAQNVDIIPLMIYH